MGETADETPSLHEWAGGRAGLERLLNALSDRVEADELIAPLFSRGRERRASAPRDRLVVRGLRRTAGIVRIAEDCLRALAPLNDLAVERLRRPVVEDLIARSPSGRRGARP